MLGCPWHYEMGTDAEILAEIAGACATRERPEHFTDYRHCCECAEHDDVLRSRDFGTLAIEDVGSAAWDPICFVQPEGFIYFLPALARLALAAPDPHFGWYAPQLLIHLAYDGAGNARWQAASPAQRRAVVRLLEHMLDTRAELVGDYVCADDLLRAHEIWSAAQ